MALLNHFKQMPLFVNDPIFISMSICLHSWRCFSGRGYSNGPQWVEIMGGEGGVMRDGVGRRERGGGFGRDGA